MITFRTDAADGIVVSSLATSASILAREIAITTIDNYIICREDIGIHTSVKMFVCMCIICSGFCAYLPQLSHLY